jgi:hypothetical protein
VEYDLPNIGQDKQIQAKFFTVPYLSKFLVSDEVAGTFMICQILETRTDTRKQFNIEGVIEIAVNHQDI